jgi:hypothetical protein
MRRTDYGHPIDLDDSIEVILPAYYIKMAFHSSGKSIAVNTYLEILSQKGRQRTTEAQ